MQASEGRKGQGVYARQLKAKRPECICKPSKGEASADKIISICVIHVADASPLLVRAGLLSDN